MKSSLNQFHPAWFGCNQKMRPWSSAIGVLLSNPLRYQSTKVGSYPWGMPYLSLWSQRTSSTSRWPFWPSLLWLASRDSILLVWTLLSVVCEPLLLWPCLTPARTPISPNGWEEKRAIHSTCGLWSKDQFWACLRGSRWRCPGSPLEML